MSRAIPEKFYNMKVSCDLKVFGFLMKNINKIERAKLEKSDIDQMININLDPENIDDIKTGFSILLSRHENEFNKKLVESGYDFVDIHCTGNIDE